MSLSRKFLLILLPAVPLLFGFASAQISPGELSEPHVELEGISNCSRCHDPERTSSAERCLGCHGEIKIQFEEGKGFHKKKDCGSCHSEHNGRDFELIYWEGGIETFDHDGAGFALTGKHAKIKCRECHRRDHIVEQLKDLNRDVNLDRTYLGLVSQCRSCHKDVHRAPLGRECQECHGSGSWTPAEFFDHDRTDYPLKGEHIPLACEKCHKSVKGEDSAQKDSYVRYVGLQYDDCSSCHGFRHRSRLGTRCDGCHTTEGWRSSPDKHFDHSKTRFVLKGRHVDVECKSCHGEKNQGSPIHFERCTDCHRDVHLSGFRSESYSGNCEKCHSEERWVPSSFGLAEHDSSSYTLTGAHRAVSCISCHQRNTKTKQILFTIETRECRSCHEDRHHGQFDRTGDYKGCESCHTTAGWDPKGFDHQNTHFPLDGLHVNVRCGGCHPRVLADSGEEYVKYTSLDRNCHGCHGKETEEFFERERMK